MSYEHTLDATVVGTLHILGQPVLAQDLFGHLDHDVVGFEQAGLQVVAVAGDALQTGLLEADYIVIEMAKQILGENWLPEYVQRANNGGIERVLV